MEPQKLTFSCIEKILSFENLINFRNHLNKNIWIVYIAENRIVIVEGKDKDEVYIKLFREFSNFASKALICDFFSEEYKNILAEEYGGSYYLKANHVKETAPNEEIILVMNQIEYQTTKIRIIKMIDKDII